MQASVESCGYRSPEIQGSVRACIFVRYRILISLLWLHFLVGTFPQV